MRALHVIGSAAVLLAVTACGQSDRAGSPGTATSSTGMSATALPGSPVASAVPAPAPTVPSLPQGGTQLPKGQVDTGGLPPYYEKQEVVVAPDGMSVTVWGMARDSCSGVQGTVTEETDQVIRIVLSPMAAPQGGSPDKVCAQVLTPVPVTVQLKAPVGNRTVIVTEKQTY
ncbi:hypothetical protein [Actinophytocola sp.]|uniref:hypothetical protein n=1 Tax=Actinophytocola sp. TaxID=1872138 RepID=UPI002D7F9AD4|nr:hypothetical protein [Actinophytocola sp.]HET9138042.1 hypothetical protein [Actinophytocola sp.]